MNVHLPGSMPMRDAEEVFRPMYASVDGILLDAGKHLPADVESVYHPCHGDTAG